MNQTSRPILERNRAGRQWRRAEDLMKNPAGLVIYRTYNQLVRNCNPDCQRCRKTLQFEDLSPIGCLKDRPRRAVQRNSFLILATGRSRILGSCRLDIEFTTEPLPNALELDDEVVEIKCNFQMFWWQRDETWLMATRWNPDFRAAAALLVCKPHAFLRTSRRIQRSFPRKSALTTS
jgi:hypothetical protein